jgi:GNAT superfamily N-acetyltransferase
MTTLDVEEKTDLLRIEQAAVRSWPALESCAFDGWMLRVSSGGSIRANSVSTLDYSGDDLARSIAEVVTFYRARAACPRFTITDVSKPADLDAALAALGWTRQADHVTMTKAIGPAAAAPSVVPPSPVTVVRHLVPTADWYRVYLDGLSDDRRVVAPKLVEGVPEPRCFFSAMRDGRVVASGLSVLDGAMASVQCMATLPQARRGGAARAVLAAIEAFAREGGASQLYLQAEAGNHAALTLYRSVGFAVAGHYHMRQLPP